MRRLVMVIVFLCLTAVYYNSTFEEFESTNVILTIASFLFAIFTGFFISRQGRRYNHIRETIANFDGEMSALYRTFNHTDSKISKQAAEIIKNHYQKILKNKAWDYQFIHKSETITKLHQLLDHKKIQADNWLMRTALDSLGLLQKYRKRMITLQIERIPIFQWVLIIVLTLILLVTLAFLSSENLIVFSLIKGAFGTALIIVVVLLHQFDRLQFFEGMIGEKSARDVLDIIAGKK